MSFQPTEQCWFLLLIYDPLCFSVCDICIRCFFCQSLTAYRIIGYVAIVFTLIWIPTHSLNPVRNYASCGFLVPSEHSLTSAEHDVRRRDAGDADQWDCVDSPRSDGHGACRCWAAVHHTGSAARGLRARVLPSKGTLLHSYFTSIIFCVFFHFFIFNFLPIFFHFFFPFIFCFIFSIFFCKFCFPLFFFVLLIFVPIFCGRR